MLAYYFFPKKISYLRRDSNPQHRVSKTRASADWATKVFVEKVGLPAVRQGTYKVSQHRFYRPTRYQLRSTFPFFFAAMQGFEPQSEESKSSILPIELHGYTFLKSFSKTVVM